MQANCYLVGAGDSVEVFVIDPGEQAAGGVEQALKQLDRRLAAVLLTHGHLDHCAAAAELANHHDVPVYCHRFDWPMLTHPMLGLLPDFEPYAAAITGPGLSLPLAKQLIDYPSGELTLAGIDLAMQHAPGHSPGSVVLTVQDEDQPVAFTGDVIFAGSIGRVDLPGGDAQQMAVSLAQLKDTISAQATLLPGHGPASTMADELANNRFLQ